jgi:hypothetical protein
VILLYSVSQKNQAGICEKIGFSSQMTIAESRFEPADGGKTPAVPVAGVFFTLFQNVAGDRA